MNNTFVSIDGEQLNARQIISKVKGVDIPSLTVVIGLQRANIGNVEEVELFRMADSRIANKRAIFELFIKILDNIRKHHEADAEKLVQQESGWLPECLSRIFPGDEQN